MALQPYSGDPRRPSTAAAPAPAPSYFTAAAIQAGYAMAAPPPPAAHRDALHRELHDEHVREEYLAREIAHRRLLLDQRLRHQPAPIYPSLTEFGAASVPQRVEMLPARLPHFLEVGVDGRPVERLLGYTRTPAALRPKAVIRKQRPVKRAAVVSRAESTLPQKLSGIKRKAATMESSNDPQQKDKKWSCSLCQVFATSEQDLKKHLQGQKHKANKESRRSQSKVADKSLPTDGLKEVNKQLSTNIAKESFFCDVCKVKCNSQSMLNSHLNGKRHKEGSLNSQSKVPDKTGEQGLIAKKQKAVHESHGSQSKVADKVLPVDGSKQVNKLLSTNLVPEEQKQSNPVPNEQKLCCEVCKVKCTSRSNLNSHLNGKRHKESLTLLAKEPGNVTSAGTSMEANKLTSLVAVKETKPGVEENQVLKSKPAVQQKQVVQQKQAIKENAVVPQKQSFNCDDCKLECKSLTYLKSHLNGKKHKARLQELNKVQDDKLLTSEDNKLANDKPAKAEVQSFNCDDCKLKCNSLSSLKSHLNGKKHKAQLEELNKVQDDKLITSEDNKLANDKPAEAEQSGNENKLVNAVETKLASDKPDTAEQSGNDSTCEVTGEDGSLVA